MRALHPGRPGPDPFAAGPIAAAQTAAEHALPEVCRFGTVTVTQDPNPPYGDTVTFDAVDTGVPCLVEPAADRPVDPADDPAVLSTFDVRLPHGTPVVVDHVIDLTSGRNAGSRFRVVEVHDSSTEPLLRTTCDRITTGDP